jgi:Domain of unknown function (DUF4440)
MDREEKNSMTMTNSSNLVLWILNSLLNAGGVLAAAHAWNTRYIKKYSRLVWLLPAVLIAAWLGSFFGAQVVGQAISAVSLPLFWQNLATNLFAYLMLGLVFLVIRRATMKRGGASVGPKRAEARGGIGDTSLRQTVESFLAAADSADVDRLAATYAPDFQCTRVADGGGFVQLTADQMLSFLKRATSGKAVGHTVPTKNSTIHHVEIFGDSAVVLVTRMKDLGNGWEPLFYTLLWKKQNSSWYLLREFVHQRTAPNWA